MQSININLIDYRMPLCFRLIVACPVGTFYDKETLKCKACGPGSYQDREGQTSCLFYDGQGKRKQLLTDLQSDNSNATGKALEVNNDINFVQIYHQIVDLKGLKK